MGVHRTAGHPLAKTSDWANYHRMAGMTRMTWMTRVTGMNWDD